VRRELGSSLKRRPSGPPTAILASFVVLGGARADLPISTLRVASELTCESAYVAGGSYQSQVPIFSNPIAMPPPPQVYPLMNVPPGDCDFIELGGIETNLAKEDMSIAFVSALVAHAGLQASNFYRHDDGIDLQIGCTKDVVNGLNRRNPTLFVQMKATSHPEIDGDNIVFRLTRQAYDKLVSDSTVPQALIVYIMPDDRQRWAVFEESHIDLVGHAFFFNMSEAPPLGATGVPKVVIPFSQRLTTRSLIEYFQQALRNHYL
jgi:hypothetical protein